MIKSDELRLWNFVFDKKQNKIDVIDAIEENRVSLLYSKFPYTPINLIEPVELTPDILEAAGFGVNKDNSFGYINENEGILIELGDFYEDDGRAVFYYNLPDTDNSTCIAYCKYLHQLQNIYWCLCGEELQIDITKLNK